MHWTFRQALCAVFLAAAALAAARAQTAVKPQVFAPFELPPASSIMDIAFAKDGRTMYATLSSSVTHRYAIVESRRAGAGWTAPNTVTFSGTWRDLEEVLAPDGSYMIFSSNRPIVAGGSSIDAFYHRHYRRGGGGNLWIVRRAGAGWGVPQRLPEVINANTSTFSPAVAADGTLYFMRATGTKGSFHLFVSHLVEGTYKTAQPAPFADDRYGEFDPTVAPDDSFVVFSSTRAPVPHGTAHLFISYNRGGRWSPPVDLGQPVNAGGHDSEARLSPDTKELYYTSPADPAHLDAAIAPTAPYHVLSLPFKP